MYIFMCNMTVTYGHSISSELYVVGNIHIVIRAFPLLAQKCKMQNGQYFFPQLW